MKKNKKVFAIAGGIALLVFLMVLFRAHFSEFRSAESQNDAGTAPPKIEETDRQFLISQGLKDPAGDIMKDLLSHPELIPCKGTLGGVHDFYSDGISILGRNKVKATFGDGHNDGVMELTFTVSKGNISWKVVKWDCEDVED